MRNLMKLYPYVVILLTLVFGRLLSASQVVEKLPTSWYLLPEEAPFSRAAWNEMEAEGPSAEAVQNLDRVLGTSASAFDDYAVSQTHSDPKKWYLAACVLDVAVYGSGLLGVLVAKGEASAALYWRPKQLAASDSEPADLLILDQSPERVQERLEPIVRAVMATGKVKDEPRLRKNLLETIISHQKLMESLNYDPGSSWYVSRLRLDFTVDISGQVYPGTTLGGGVRLRFEWDPKAYGDGKQRDGTTAASSPHYGLDLKKFVRTVARELEAVKYDDLAHTGFDLKQLRIGIGIFGDGKFGVVKAGASLMGHLYFSKRNATGSHTLEVSGHEAIPVITGQPTNAELDYARDESIRYESFRSSYDGKDVAVFFIPVEKFRKGLEKAVRIGKFFTERASNDAERRWELYQIKAEFALSLSGTVAVVTLGGTAAMELVFQRTKRAWVAAEPLPNEPRADGDYRRRYPKLTSFVEAELKNVGGALSELNASDPMGLNDWQFRRLFLRLQAKVGFDIKVAKLELVPELELVMQKQ